MFVDIERDTFNIDAGVCKPRDHAGYASYYGRTLRRAHGEYGCAGIVSGLPIIEDAAHAHGSEWKGKRAGSVGVAGSFSFQNSKVITAGEGGFITTNDHALAQRVRAIGNQGRREDRGWFEHYTLGTNYRLTALQAAVLLPQLERLPEQNQRRARNARTIREGCPQIEWQRIPCQAAVQTNYLLLGHITNRNRFHAAVMAAGVPCTPFYPHTLYNNPLYRDGGCRVTPCPVAEQAVEDAFWFPHRVLLGDEETTQQICSAIQSAI